MFYPIIIAVIFFLIYKYCYESTPEYSSKTKMFSHKKRGYALKLNTKELRCVILKGVGYENRENNLSECVEGDQIFLKREPHNKHDKNAIAVYSKSNKMLGYLPRKQMSLAKYLDSGGLVVAHIKNLYWDNVHRNGKYIEGLLCDLDIVPYDNELIKQYISEDYALKKLYYLTWSEKETESPTDAILAYSGIIKRIIKFDSNQEFRKYRTVHVPINRISMLLYRNKQFNKCKEIIDWYLSYNDHQEIHYKDKRAIDRRLERVTKKLS